MNSKLAILALAICPTILAACNRAPTEISFGIYGSAFHCNGGKCDVVFFLENQMPSSVTVEYQAELTNECKEVVSEFTGLMEVPALETVKVSKTVAAAERPDRLGVTVTDLRRM